MNAFQPAVSIIIPVYNGANYLKEAIDSALAQTYQNIEVLVVNDGSCDQGATKAIANSYGTKIRYFSKTNGGVASALNLGISHMRGEYFSWLSHDDVYFPEKISHQIDILSKLNNPNTILYGGYEVIDKHSKIIHCIKPEEKFELKKLNNTLLPLMRGLIHGCALLIPKKYFDEIRLFDETLLTTQDYDLWFDFFRRAPLHYDSRILIQSRAHPEQSSYMIPSHVEEGNCLLIGFLEKLTEDEMNLMEGSRYRYLSKTALHLSGSPFAKTEQTAIYLADKLLKKTKISVIIPFYNRVDWLIQAIQSVQNQTHQEFEIILVDDGSSEDINVLLNIIHNDRRIRYIRQDNSGPSSARNKGINAANGRYIAFLDSDDLFHPKKLELQLRYMEQEGLSFSHTSFEKVDAEANLLEHVSAGKFKGNVFPNIMYACPIIVPTVMCLTTVLKNHPFPTNINLGEDICVWLTLASKFELGGIDEPLSQYRVTSTTTISSRKKLALSLINIATYIINHPVLCQYSNHASALLRDAGVTYQPEIPSLHPKVSIIIPVYNGANYLSDAIESAISQTYQNIEIIVINDGSDDNGATEAVALSYADNIRYFSKPNGGVASALNFGISQMTGDYFSWLSHDDLYLANKISQQIKTLLEINNNRAILYSDYSVFTIDANKDIPCHIKGVSPWEFRYWLTVENRLHGCTLLIPKSAFIECGYFDENLRTTQDYDLWFRLAKQYQFIHIPAVLVKSRSHSEQGSLKMAHLVLHECNNLLSNFVNSLSVDEIYKATFCTPALGYAKIASSMWYRGFFPSGRTAAKLSLKYAFKTTCKEIVLAQCILAKGIIMHNFIKPIRKLLSPYARLSIQNFLKKVHHIVNAKMQVTLPQNPTPFPQLATNSIKVSACPPDISNEMTLEKKFSVVYEKNMFGGGISRSGEGSDLVQTATIRHEIPKLINEFKINSVLDAPCGDWHWMSQTQLNIQQYIGVDIVEELILKNQAAYGNTIVQFQHKNLVIDKLPKVDLIFSRDCLVHLSNKDALAIIQNFKDSGAKYLLTTTFAKRNHNEDLGEGFWRTLNLQLSPFNFPAPLKLINEGCTEENNAFSDKCLGLWKLEDLSID